MNTIFRGPVADELHRFLQFKQSLGYRYVRAEFTLREFDRFLIDYADGKRVWHLDRAAIAWLSTKPGRKPISVSADAAVVRQFFAYMHRFPNRRFAAEPLWPKLPTESSFVPHFLSEQDIQKMLALCGTLKRPPFRAILYRTLLLMLYCTGIRFGEGLRLRVRDVDIPAAVLFVEPFKGRARWVPFHRSLSRELQKYCVARAKYAPLGPDTPFFIGANNRNLAPNTASDTIRTLFRLAGLKPAKGRFGPRPYDFRHAFAVQRLSQWYRKRADLHACLPWLSAYMGHTDILGTETYLNATPELLNLAGNRLRRHYRRSQDQKSHRT